MNYRLAKGSMKSGSPPFSIAVALLCGMLRLLEHEHLVVNVPRKGTYVTTISREDFTEVYNARQMIESYAIDLLKAKNIRDLPQVASVLDDKNSLYWMGNRGEVALYVKGKVSAKYVLLG